MAPPKPNCGSPNRRPLDGMPDAVAGVHFAGRLLRQLALVDFLADEAVAEFVDQGGPQDARPGEGQRAGVVIVEGAVVVLAAAGGRIEDRAAGVIEAQQAETAEQLVVFGEVVIDAAVECVARRVPRRVADEILARAGAGEVGLRPQLDHLRRGRVEARARDAVVGERLPGHRIAQDRERRGEGAVALLRRGHNGQVGLGATLAAALPASEEKSLVAADGPAQGGAELVLLEHLGIGAAVAVAIDVVEGVAGVGFVIAQVLESGPV